MVVLGRLVALAAAAGLTLAAPSRHSDVVGTRASSNTSSTRLVFCHFMIGIVSDRTGPSDFDADMQLAKSLGIDAFALNIGVDPYTDQQLGYAYQSAINNDMKVFISFDFNWWSATQQAAAIGQKIAQYATYSSQLKVDGKVFVSSFAGDALDVPTMRSASGLDLFFAPNFHPELTADPSHIDGALNWMAWDNNGNNKAPTPGANVTVEQGDATYQKWLNGKAYVAPVSAWFSTHFGPEVSYSKNWVFPSDLLWFRRWNDILSMQPEMLEIVTWNDYGECHYISPLYSPHTDDGSSKWVNDMPHDGWLQMAKPYIAAYKDGAASVDSYIKSDLLVYWYRQTPSSSNCDATDTTMVTANNSTGNYFEGRPDGYQDMQDAVFVVAMLTAPGDVYINSGGTLTVFLNVPAGATALQVDMGLGAQQFSLVRGGTTVLSDTSLKEITSDCVCGIYNYNAYVGTIPANSSSDHLSSISFNAFETGLKVSTCSPTPSLPTVAPAATAPTKTNIVTYASGTDVVVTNPVGNATATATPTTGTTTTGGGGSTTNKATSSTSTPTTVTGTTATTTATTTAVVKPITTTTTAAGATGTCAGGTVAGGMSGNYLGLCSFCCSYGYCPPGPCMCTSTGVPAPTPPVTGQNGCPLTTEDDSYLGLCSFACNHGYCPDTACRLC